MQQTSIDRWLRKKFLFVTSLYCNTLPDDLPKELAIDEAGEESGARYRYKLTTRNEEIVEDATECFRMQNITYTSRVSDREVWFSKYLNNRKKSITFQMIWIFFALAFAGVVYSGAPVKLWQALVDEETDEEIAEIDDPTDDIKISVVEDTTVHEIDRER